MKLVYQNPQALTIVESSAEEMDIGSYGRKWVNFMKRCHPNLVREMLRKGTFYEVAQSVDDRAWEYDEFLTKQYMDTHPCPNTFEENVKYHTTKKFYINGAVMREKVLIPYTSV